jgi:hypothetical protein
MFSTYFLHIVLGVEGYRVKTLDYQFTLLFWWWLFCQRFVLQEKEDINHHILNHIPAYDAAFCRQGYYAISQDHLTNWPILCPVCVRDIGKGRIERFTPVYRAKRYTSKDLWGHLYYHFESTELFPSIIPCPLSTCTPDGITATCDHISFPMPDLAQHFGTCNRGKGHEKGIDSERKKTRRKKRAHDNLKEESKKIKRVILGSINLNT